MFEVLCNYYLTHGEDFFQTGDVYGELSALGLSDEQMGESLEILSGRGFIETKAIAGGDIWGIKLYSFSLHAFLCVAMREYDSMVIKIISQIVNQEQTNSKALQENTGIPLPIVLHVLRFLRDKGLLQLTGPAGFAFFHAFNVSPELKRILHH